MPDRDVINHLQIIRTWAAVDGESRRGIDPQCCGKIVEWIDDAIALLKEQTTPLEPIADNVNDVLLWHCAKCGFYLGPNDHFCSNCGRAVKWDEG